MKAPQPPLQYLLTSSETCLEGFENARHNQIANVRKEIHQAIDDLVSAESDARISRWILDRRRAQSGFAFPEIETARSSEGNARPLFGDATFGSSNQNLQTSHSLPSADEETSNHKPSRRASLRKRAEQLPLVAPAPEVPPARPGIQQNASAIASEQNCASPRSAAAFALQSLEERLARSGFLFRAPSPRQLVKRESLTFSAGTPSTSRATLCPSAGKITTEQVPAKHSERQPDEHPTPSRSRNVIPMIIRRKTSTFQNSEPGKLAPSKNAARGVPPRLHSSRTKSGPFRSAHRIA